MFGRIIDVGRVIAMSTCPVSSPRKSKTRHRRSNVRERITLAVRPQPGRRTRGCVIDGARIARCALGPAGPAARKCEGDGATPAGRWKLLGVFYRADRVARPVTALPVRALRASDGWCDAPADRNYNRLVTLPYAASAEAMWRADSIYDIVVILDHNTRPRMRARGSAIFIHLARDGYPPTGGCIALSSHDLRMLLRACGPGSQIAVFA